MRTIRRIFSINTVILAFAIFALFLGLRQIVEIFEGIDTLIVHKGIVNKKYLSNKYFTSRGTVSVKEDQDSVRLFQFRIVGDTALYTASRYAKGLDNLIQVEDSVIFYTKPVTSRFGNTVSNGKGRIWKTDSPSEVYHLITPSHDSPLIDYNEHIDSIKESIWIWPLFSLLLFGWFFYRRSRVKSPFVSETSRATW